MTKSKYRYWRAKFICKLSGRECTEIHQNEDFEVSPKIHPDCERCISKIDRWP